MIDVDKIKRDFPILSIKINGKPFVYLDNAATSQKPTQVIGSIVEYYSKYNANVHRGIYRISEKATEEYIKSKEKTAKFINAGGIENIVYTRNTTEAINTVALSWGGENIKKGDHILITDMEHHSNIVPWLLLARKNGAIVDYVKLDRNNEKLDIQSLKENLEKEPKIVSVTHASNVLGVINDVKYITGEAHKHNAIVMVDGAQSVPHMKVDVKKINCEFFAFSAHKMLGPTGIGVLYGKTDVLNAMNPLFGGGDMIRTVTRNSYTWNSLPWKFEAGTPNIEGGIALGVAIDYLNKIGIENIDAHEQELTKYALNKLSGIKDIELFGPTDIKVKTGVISFGIKGVHPHDVSQIFDDEGIAIRAGHHCAMPLVTEVLHKGAVSRISFYLYNDKKDIDIAINAINKVKRIFKI